MSLFFLQQVMVKKSKKFTKIFKIEEVKNSYLLRHLMNFNKIFGKNLTYDDIKSD